jgi:hypothetical protein
MYKIQLRRDKQADNVYLNFELNNNEDNEFVEVSRFNIERYETIIENPSDYYLSVMRFSIPSVGIPLLIFPVQEGQPNINLGTLSITLEYNGNVSQKFLIYIPKTGSPLPNPPLINQDIKPYYYVYNYLDMVEMINIAFNSAFAEISAPLGAEAPRMIYNPLTRLFSIVAQREYYLKNSVDPIYIYFNLNFLSLFSGFDLLSTFENFTDITRQGRAWRVESIDIFNNSYTDPTVAPASYVYPSKYIKIEQQYASVQNWYAIKTMVLTSNRLPLRKEFVGNGNNIQPIFQDFEPSKNIFDLRGSYQFFPTGEFRLVDLIGTEPIKNFDINIYWQDVYGNLNPIEIPYLQTLTIKLAFFKKSNYRRK